jgi:hypothetical protein
MCDLALLFTLLIAMSATRSSPNEESLSGHLFVCPDIKPTALPSIPPWLAQAVNPVVARTCTLKRRATESTFPGPLGEAGISGQSVFREGA